MILHLGAIYSPRLLAIGAVTGLATFCGGGLALRLGSKLGVLAAFGGGAMIGVALADLLPEALTLSTGYLAPLTLTLLMLAGFVSYMTLDRLFAVLADTPFSRSVGPASLVLHSLLDGVGIGLAFNVSPAVGLVVAGAVLTHDLVDGANTVTLSLAGSPMRRRALAWLALDSLAPLGGIAASRVIAPTPTLLAPLLALFAGFFLHIATSELLPRGRSAAPLMTGIWATILGTALVVLIALVQPGESGP